MPESHEKMPRPGSYVSIKVMQIEATKSRGQMLPGGGPCAPLPFAG